MAGHECESHSLTHKYFSNEGISTRVQCTFGTSQCIFFRSSQYENGILNVQYSVPCGEEGFKKRHDNVQKWRDIKEVEKCTKNEMTG